MYLNREIDNVLIEWGKSNKHKPVLLRGVRQCGKTHAVQHYGEQFETYVEINLEQETELTSLFEGNIDIKRIISSLELYSGKRIVPGKTLLFIDEIQKCPRAITSLRYFYEKMPDLHVIAAESLLEFALDTDNEDKVIDFPVGRIRSIFMYPFSFYEYLKATGNEMLADYITQHNSSSDNLIAHKKILEIYKTFLIVGGMPEAVATYVESGNFLDVQQVHREIILNYKDDFGKYSKNVSKDIIEKVFDYAIHNVCNQTKSSSAIEGVSSYYFDESIKILHKAGLVHPVKATSCDTLPLASGGKDANKKLVFFDTGVYLTECDLDTNDILISDLFEKINKGNVVEMQTGLEIIKNSNVYKESNLYYWYRSGANAEVDYVISKGEKIIPIEVKASTKGSMQSMRSFISTHRLSEYGIRVSLENFCEYEDIHVYPVYAIRNIIQ